jgi:opacity protein-like surface antigen
MKKRILAAALLTYSTSFVMAESVEPKNPSKARAMTGLVLGAQAGFSSGFNPPDIINSGSGNASISNSSGGFNFGGFIGYDFAINDRFSVGAEIDINYTPDIYKADASAGNDSFDYDLSILNVPIMATAKYVAPFGLNVFAKGGINYQRAYQSGSCSGFTGCGSTLTESDSNWTGVLAGGVGYQLNKVNIFAQYMYIFGTDLDSYLNSSDSKAIKQGIITGGVSITLPM